MTALLNKIFFKGLELKAKAIDMVKKEDGETNIIAIILILAIVIALAIIFKSQLSSLFNKIWSSLFDNVDSVL